MKIYKLTLCSCVHRKGQHQLTLEEKVSHRSAFVPTTRANLARNTLSDLGHWGWDTMRYPRIIPGQSSLGKELATPISHEGKISQILCQKAHCELLMCFFGSVLEATGADADNRYICQALLHQPLNYPPKVGCQTFALHNILPSSIHMQRQCHSSLIVWGFLMKITYATVYR